MGIKFTPNSQKIVEAVLYVLERKPETTIYELMKILFSADCYSLNTYGVPVTGDRYKIMQHGTVPETAYDMVCGNPLAFSDTTDDTLPFSKVGTKNLHSNRSCNRSLLSSEAITALNHGISEYSGLSFTKIKSKNHAHKAYINAERERREYVAFEDMIENPDVLSYYEEIGSFSENMVV